MTTVELHGSTGALSPVVSLLVLPVARFTLLDSSDTAGAF